MLDGDGVALAAGLAGPLADGDPAADGDWLAGDVAAGDAQPDMRISAPNIRAAAPRRNAGPAGRLSVRIIGLGRSVLLVVGSARCLRLPCTATVHQREVRAMALAARLSLLPGPVLVLGRSVLPRLLSISSAAQSFAVPAGRQTAHRLRKRIGDRAYVRCPAGRASRARDRRNRHCHRPYGVSSRNRYACLCRACIAVVSAHVRISSLEFMAADSRRYPACP